MIVSLHYNKENGRARSLMSDISKGMVANRVRTETGQMDADVHIFYGMSPTNVDKINRLGPDDDYFVMDLGYWNRATPGDLKSHFKICYKSLHPDKYVMKMPNDPIRFLKSGAQIRKSEWNPNPDTPILITGMGEKSCHLFGFEPLEWEIEVVKKIKSVTDRPIVFRPKPSWKDCPTIKGVKNSSNSLPLAPLIKNSYAVVSYHSNCSLDAMVFGTPAISEIGAIKAISQYNVEEIESIRPPANRTEFMHKVAYCQWSQAEFRDGSAWKFLAKEFLNGYKIY